MNAKAIALSICLACLFVCTAITLAWIWGMFQTSEVVVRVWLTFGLFFVAAGAAGWASSVFYPTDPKDKP